MATCPKCRKYFRTLEDEDGMHACPRCGYDGDERTIVKWRNHRCDAGDRCTREYRTITVGYDAKDRILEMSESGITITVNESGPTFRHTGCPDLGLEKFLAERAAEDRFDELAGFVLGDRPEN